MKGKEKVFLNTPESSALFLKGYGNKKQEHFGLICLDGENGVIRRKVLFIGGTATCQIDTKIIFWEACRASAAAVVLFHNHPLGRTEPSKPDIATTKELNSGFASLGIMLLDHIIIGKDGDYFSFLENDMIIGNDRAKQGLVADKS